MRRLPIYLLLDTSGSMSGEPIEAVRNGVQILLSALRQDPYALETAYLSIITFDTKARQVVPLTELTAFQVPELNATGVTALGEALKLVTERAEAEVMKTTSDQKGDWKPVVFLMTDGTPTDDWKKGLAAFHKHKFGMVVACGFGGNASLDVLKAITENVLQLEHTDSATIRAFFKWVSSSISTTSQKVDEMAKEVKGLDELPPPPAEVKVVV